MSAERLLEQFHRLAGAPDAIPRLRQLVLSLAVRGRLIEHQPFEVSSSDPDGIEMGQSEVLPYQIPANWIWTSVEDVGQSRLGKMLDKTKNKGKPRKYLRNLNVRWFGFDLEDLLEMNFEDKELEKFGLESGDVLICEGGEPGRSAVWEGEATGVFFQKALHRVRFTPSVSPYFFVKVMREASLSGRLEAYFTGSGIKHLTGRGLSRFLFPLPPRGEQDRIVRRIDELMALCDSLETVQAEREDQRDRLVTASLARLTHGEAPEVLSDEARSDTRFHLGNFSRMLVRPEHIGQLRQTILDLAVRGRLVPQDPSDEPASVLLGKIKKKNLAAHSKSKRGRKKNKAAATKVSRSVVLPPGWEAVELGEILAKLQTGPFGSSLHRRDYQEGGVPVINPASIKNKGLIPVAGMAVGEATLERLSAFELESGDIVVGRRGEMGRCAVVEVEQEGWLCGTGSLILRLPAGIYPEFVAELIRSPGARQYLAGSSVGSTMQNLNQSILLGLRLGLPPELEQRRIVAKIDELMALCDELEAQLESSQEKSRQLLEAVLHEALHPAVRSRSETHP